LSSTFSISSACTDCVEDRWGPDCTGECPPCGAFGRCDSGVDGTGVCTCDAGYAGPFCTPLQDSTPSSDGLLIDATAIGAAAAAAAVMCLICAAVPVYRKRRRRRRRDRRMQHHISSTKGDTGNTTVLFSPEHSGEANTLLKDFLEDGFSSSSTKEIGRGGAAVVYRMKVSVA
jgi:hypothetical protein